jgi:circadian clock protein KaiB
MGVEGERATGGNDNSSTDGDEALRDSVAGGEGNDPASRESSASSDAASLELERALQSSKTAHYILRLYVAGSSPQSALAISNIKRVCETSLLGRYDLQVIDIYQQPELARGEQIVAAPTLIKILPHPLRRLIGNLSDMDRVLVGLGLKPV